MGEAALEILKCPSCGAPVPFGDADVALCTRCKTEVPLPEEHRAVREARKADPVAVERANEVLASVDDPSWLVTRVVAIALDLPMMAFLIFYGVPVGLTAIFTGIAAGERLGPSLGLETEASQMALSVAVIFATILLLTFVPRALGVYSMRRTVSKMKLLAALAAKPPSAPGGPSHCRFCGAPLVAAEAGKVARCNYCATDNAIVAPTRIVREVVGRVARIRTITEEVARENTRERAETRKKLFAELRRYSFRTLVLGGLAMVYFVDFERPEVKEGGNAPGVGIAALVVMVLVGIFFVIRSSGITDDDAAERRKAMGLEWVRYVGPPSVWVLLYVASFLFQLYAEARFHRQYGDDPGKEQQHAE